ncbi:uncharacterized protein LOC144172829 [Haemaphysalis longicornis]
MSRGVLELRGEDEVLHPPTDGHHEDNPSAVHVENPHGALNYETLDRDFDVGGVECLDEVGELEDRAKQPPDSSSKAYSLDDEDSLNFEDLVQRSISHLGLDDDKDDDDPAIMAYARATPSPGPFNLGRRGSSPPPPVILQQRFDGSPLMETIWTPKPVLPSAPNDRLLSLLRTLQQQQRQQTQPPGSSSLPPNARTLEDVEREILNSASSHPVPSGTPRPESPSVCEVIQAERLEGGDIEPPSVSQVTQAERLEGGDSESPSVSQVTQAERLEGGDSVKPSSQLSQMSGDTTNHRATKPAKSELVEHQPDVLPRPPSSGQPRTPQIRFSPHGSAYPPGMQAGPVLPAPVGNAPPRGRMPGPSRGRMAPRIPRNGFGNRAPLPPRPDLIQVHAMRGQLPLPSNLGCLQPRTPQVCTEPRNPGRRPDNPQFALQSTYGNQGGATFGSPATSSGNRMTLPPMPHPTSGPSAVMMPPGSPMVVNDPAMRGQTPLPSSLPAFQPGITPIRFQPQNSSASPYNQQHAYQATGFGNQAGATFGSTATGFGNRMPLAPISVHMLGPGWIMMPPYSPMLHNDPAMRGPMQLASNLPGFQPGINQVLFGLQNSGSNRNYQQHAYQAVFGNQGGAIFGSPHQAGGGIQQQILLPYPMIPFPGTVDSRGGSNGSSPQGGSVVAVSNGPTVVTQGS